MKGNIHWHVLSTNIFLCHIGEPRYRQNKTSYQIIKIVKYWLIPNSYNMIPCIVLRMLPAPLYCTVDCLCSKCTQGCPLLFEYKQSYVQYWVPKYRQNNTGYQILRIGYYSIFNYLDKLIPCIVLSISRLPDIPKRTFHLMYVPAF